MEDNPTPAGARCAESFPRTRLEERRSRGQRRPSPSHRTEYCHKHHDQRRASASAAEKRSGPTEGPSANHPIVEAKRHKCRAREDRQGACEAVRRANRCGVHWPLASCSKKKRVEGCDGYERCDSQTQNTAVGKGGAARAVFDPPALRHASLQRRDSHGQQSEIDLMRNILNEIERPPTP